MGLELTPPQEKALEFISTRIHAGCAPTLKELCSHMGFRAVGSAQDVIAALKKKGFLSANDRQAARAFALTEKARRILNASVSLIKDEIEEYFAIPCLGAVPAGNPLEAIEERIDTMRVSTSLLPRPKPKANQLFAVRTKGLSMINAGILDGDWLVVKYQPQVDAGNIVVARVGSDVTCKRLLKDERKGWYLKPENQDFSPIYAKDANFEIVGQVIALQRSL